jgi:hypothetical protein
MTRTVAVNERGLRIGEDHPNARYTDKEIETVLSLRNDGLSYGGIACLLEMPKSTVASICKGGRRCQTSARWKTIEVEHAEQQAVLIEEHPA